MENFKKHSDFFKDFENLKTDLRKSIKQYINKFDQITNIESHCRIDFIDAEFGCYEKQLKISTIINEGSNIGIYSSSKKYCGHSENTIGDVHELMMILSILESNIKL